jgi:Bacterial SH3 domain
MTKLFSLALVAATLATSVPANAQWAPPAAPPPPAPPPLGWVYTKMTVCGEPRVCPVVFVSVAADGLNVRIGPDGNAPPVMSLVNGTPLIVLDRVGAWTLVAPGCDLTPTFAWSWTAGAPLNRCWVP